MANTATLTSLSGTAVSTACIVLLKVYAEIDGDPYSEGGVLLFDNGTFLNVPDFISDDVGNTWFRITRPNGAHAIRASILDPFTPISNTVTITWGAGSCPQTLPSAPVLTATATPGAILLDWDDFVPPTVDYPPLLGWRISRLADGIPTTFPIIAYVPADEPTRYVDSDVLPGVEYGYRVIPWLGEASSGVMSNAASATVTPRAGLGLDDVRYRVGA